MPSRCEASNLPTLRAWHPQTAVFSKIVVVFDPSLAYGEIGWMQAIHPDIRARAALYWMLSQEAGYGHLALCNATSHSLTAERQRAIGLHDFVTLAPKSKIHVLVLDSAQCTGDFALGNMNIIARLKVISLIYFTISYVTRDGP